MSIDIYVETNFVLEVALLQEQSESCRKIISLCETGKARLIVPAYCLVEPYETTIRYAKERKRLSAELDKAFQQLSRSEPYQQQVNSIQEVSAFLIRSQQDEEERLYQTLMKILAVAEVVPLTSEIITSALEYQLIFDLSPQDSIIYASVLWHSRQTMREAMRDVKCFLNKNSKDFNDPEIVESLSNHGCKLIFNFDDGYSYILNNAQA